MRSSDVSLFLQLFALATTLFMFSSGQKDDCVPGYGLRVLVDCNACKCTKDGFLTNCSKYRCHGNGSAEFYVVCVEKEIKMGYCEVCKCKNEEWRCIRPPAIPCGERRSLRSIVPELDDMSEVGIRQKRDNSMNKYNTCKPGTRRIRECRECVCLNRIWSCINTCRSTRKDLGN